MAATRARDDHVRRLAAPGLLLGLGAIGLCLGLRAGGLLEGVELALYDRLLRQATPRLEAGSPVTTIAIGEADFDRYGYPIPDAILAKALTGLLERGASAVGVDLFRDGPASAEPVDLAGWAELRRVVSGTPRVVLSELLGSDGRSGVAAPDFAAPEQVGFNNLLLDPGRVVRRGYLLAWDDDGDAHTAFSLQLALRHLAREGLTLGPVPDRPEWVRLGETAIPPLDPDFGAYVGLDAGGYQLPLDYARADDAFARVDFAALVEGALDDAGIRGRVAILGTDAPSVKDDFNAPHVEERAVKGLTIHAQATDQLIRLARGKAAPIGDWPEPAETAWVAAWGLGAIALASGLGSLGWAVPALALGLLAIGGVGAALFVAGSWVPTAAPALAWTLAGGVAMGERARREARERRQLMSLFRRFSSRRVADALWRQREAFMDGGHPRPQRVTLTALLSDLKGYTAASEKMEPDELMAWIDSYMDAMTRVIEAHDGHVDDYVGDGIKANFGVPIPSTSDAAIAADARSAVRCAIEMGETLARLNDEWRARGWPTGRQRIGLYTGPAVVGAIGSAERTKYTSVGDTINTAARLEGIGGALDFDRESTLQRILIGEPTRRALGDAFEVEDLGAHAVKGKSEPIPIYRVHGETRPDVKEDPT